MKQCLSLILILTAFTITSEAQKPNTKHCYKLETETDLFDGTSHTTMSGLKYQMSMLTFHQFLNAVGDTTFMVFANITASGYADDPGMILLFDDGSRLEFPESTHSSSATAYGWSHMGTARLSRDELQQFVEKGVRAIKLGRYDQEINGNAGKSVWMTSAYCVANHR